MNESWLDTLARRAAQREVAGQADLAGQVEPAGLSRRVLLRTATGAALLSGPLRFLMPASAAAQDPNCVRRVTRSDQGDLVDCVRQPLKAFKANRRALNLALKALRNEKDPAQRRRLLKGIDRATTDMGRIVHKIEDCNFDYLAKKAAARDTCRRNPQAGAPAPPGPSPLPPPPPPPPGEPPQSECLNCQSVGGKCCMSGAELCACANPDVNCAVYGC